MSPTNQFGPTESSTLGKLVPGRRKDARVQGPGPNRRATAYTVWIENARRRELAVLSGLVSPMTCAEEIDLRIALLRERLRAAPSATVDHYVALYRGSTSPPNAHGSRQALPAQVGIECVLPPGGVDGVEACATPDGLVATTEVVGPVELLPHAHAAVRAWCRANGWEVSGTSWEVHARWSGNPDHCRTAVYHSVR
jgi:hypothetical protein